MAASVRRFGSRRRTAGDFRADWRADLHRIAVRGINSSASPGIFSSDDGAAVVVSDNDAESDCQDFGGFTASIYAFLDIAAATFAREAFSIVANRVGRGVVLLIIERLDDLAVRTGWLGENRSVVIVDFLIEGIRFGMTGIATVGQCVSNGRRMPRFEIVAADVVPTVGPFIDVSIRVDLVTAGFSKRSVSYFGQTILDGYAGLGDFSQAGGVTTGDDRLSVAADERLAAAVALPAVDR